jgi:hypothetical protein
MEIFRFILLIIHVVGGYTALVSGAISMISIKGSNVHNISGRLFYISMLLVSFSALTLSLISSNTFLLHVGIFVFYQVVAGWRSVRYKNLYPGYFDLLLLLAAILNLIFMLKSGVIVLMVFGGISALLVFIDLRMYTHMLRGVQLPKLSWMRRHIGMMMGGYIGTLTAFIVVNISLPGYSVLLWLLPTIILVPLMQYWTWKYTTAPLKSKKSIVL